MAKIDDEILSEAENAKLVLYQDFINRINAGEKLNAQEIKRFEELDLYFKRARDETEICKTVMDAARYLGVGERKIRYAVKEAKRNKLRQNNDGTFDKSELDRWFAVGGAKDARKAAEKKGHVEAERKYRELRAEEKELIVRRLRGELIPREEVERLLTARAHEFAKALQLLARRISFRCAAKSKKQYQEVFDIIESEINAILATYSRPVDGI